MFFAEIMDIRGNIQYEDLRINEPHAPEPIRVIEKTAGEIGMFGWATLKLKTAF